MTKKHQCDFCKKVAICVNAIPSKIEHKINKKGEGYVVKGYGLCKNTCYKYKLLGGDIG